jgi:hypothetical protein
VTKSRNVGKARGADWQRATAVVMNCAECGAAFTRTGRRQRYCLPQCQSAAILRIDPYRYNYAKHPGVGSGGTIKRGVENHCYKNGTGVFHQYMKNACERCGGAKFLCAHHVDRNRMNNVPSNIETLCKSCHQIEHGVYVNFFRPPRVCSDCGTMVRRPSPNQFRCMSCQSGRRGLRRRPARAPNKERKAA